jgi:hypothetical protein
MSAKDRAELEARLKADDDAEDEFEVEIGADGSYARVPYGKAKSWLQNTFGIDLDTEDRQDTPDPKASPADDGKSRFGRRVG